MAIKRLIPRVREAWRLLVRRLSIAGERERCRAILEHPCAKNRVALARFLALQTDIAPAAAIAILAASPAEHQSRELEQFDAFIAARRTAVPLQLVAGNDTRH